MEPQEVKIPEQETDDPEVLSLYNKIRTGEISLKDFSELLYADSLIEGFLNTRGFEKKLQRYLEKGIHGTLIAVDVDSFKLFNDAQGHPAGDDLLRFAGAILREQTRTTTVPENIQEKRQERQTEFDLLAHAGDEFLIFLVNAGLDDTASAANRIRQAIITAAQQAFPTYTRQQTMSFGLSDTKPGDSIRSLRERADQALYQAKGNGKNQVVIYQEK